MGPTDEEPPQAIWATVRLAWDQDPLLMTLGTSWMCHRLTTECCPARCAVLHRVALDPATCDLSLPAETLRAGHGANTSARHSIPFLVDVVERAGQDIAQS